MKRLIFLLGLVGVTSGLIYAEDVPAKATPLDLKTTRDQASYAIGQDIGRRLKGGGLDLNTAALIQGLTDFLSGRPAKLSDQQLQAAMETFDREMQAKMLEKARVEGEKNKKEGAAFLATNKTKQGVVTLPSGLQYMVMKAGKGTGPSPTINDKIKAHYHGTLINGKVFDSSIESGKPLEYVVGGLTRGFAEALQKMKVGDKWKLFVPSELAYGADGAAPDIGPHAVLIFEVELLSIEPQK